MKGRGGTEQKEKKGLSNVREFSKRGDKISYWYRQRVYVQSKREDL